MVLPSESVELESPSLMSSLCPFGILFTTFGLRGTGFGSDFTVVVVVVGVVGFEEAGVLLAGGGVATLVERPGEEVLVVIGIISTPLSCL